MLDKKARECSIEELKELLELRVAESNKIPTPLDTPDFSKIVTEMESYVNRIHHGLEPYKMDTWLLEATLEAVYGGCDMELDGQTMKTYSEYFTQDCHRARNNPERDERIISQLDCWHVEDTSNPRRWNEFSTCAKCGKDIIGGNPNLSTPNGYFWLLDLIKELGIHGYVISHVIHHSKSVLFATPDEFADAVDAYLPKADLPQISKFSYVGSDEKFPYWLRSKEIEFGRENMFYINYENKSVRIKH